MSWLETTALKRPTAIVAVASAAIAAAALAARPGSMTRGHAPVWVETAWRVPLDNWGQGRAWQSSAGVTMLARTKTGFCNCFGGIANDEEIDRIGDVDLHGETFVAAGPGEVVAVGALAGRKRLFQASTRFGGTRQVLSIVAATDCKAVVATLVSDGAVTAETEAAAVVLLRGESFQHWAANQP